MAATAQPVPFEILPDAGNGVRAASNGALTVCLTEPDGRIFRRRGITGMAAQCVGDTLIPQLNQLAGMLLEAPAMAPQEAVARLQAMASAIACTVPRNVEMAVAEVGDVRVYVDGATVVVTRRDLTP